MNSKICVLLCHCGGNAFEAEKPIQLAKLIKKLNIDVIEMHDLCALAVNERETLKQAGDDYDSILIAACYPRAVKNLLLQNKVALNGFHVLDLKSFSPHQIFEELQKKYSVEEGPASFSSLKSELEVAAWYPVIDQSRCTLCGQCARFCLFGVYQFDKKSLKVENPLSCKNLCPACGRTCPSQAIIFPRLKEKTFLAGANPDSNNQNNNVTLLAQLNQRNQGRKSIFKQDAMELAENERKQALNELKQLKVKK